MRSFEENPYFYATLVLLFILAVVLGQKLVSGGIWDPPISTPPEGMPAAPLDTSGVAQIKEGNLSIEGVLSVDGGGVFKAGDGLTINPYGYIYFGSDKNAAIYRSGTKLMAKHADGTSPFEIGSGGGGSPWIEPTAGQVEYKGTAIADKFCIGDITDCVESFSGVGGGGVIKITGGSGIDVSPLTGVGEVMLSLTGNDGGGEEFWKRVPGDFLGYVPIYYPGDVGIGINDPKARLHVDGNVMLSPSSGFYIGEDTTSREKPFQFVEVGPEWRGESVLINNEYPNGFNGSDWLCVPAGQYFFGDMNENDKGNLEYNMACVGADSLWRARYGFRTHNGDEKFKGYYLCIRREFYYGIDPSCSMLFE